MATLGFFMHLWSAMPAILTIWLLYNLGLMGFEFWVGLTCLSPWRLLILQLGSSDGSPRDRGPMREQVCIAYWVLDSKVEQCNSCHILWDWNCHKTCQDTREGKKDSAVWKQEVQGHIVKHVDTRRIGEMAQFLHLVYLGAEAWLSMRL